MLETGLNVTGKKLGRPRPILKACVPQVMALYREGSGYRSISSELTKLGILTDWSTVRRVIKSWQIGRG